MSGIRQTLYQTLVSDPGLLALGLGEGRVLTQHSKDSQPTDGAFIVIRMLERNAPLFKVLPYGNQIVQFWVHDEPSDFERIDQIIDRLKVLLPTLENTKAFGTSDRWIQDVTWQGESQDFPDDDARTVTRYCQWQFTGSAAT